MFPLSVKFNETRYAMVVGLNGGRDITKEDNRPSPGNENRTEFVYPDYKPHQFHHASYSSWDSNQGHTILEIPIGLVFNEIVRSKKNGELFVDFSPEAIKRLKQTHQPEPATS